MSVESHVCLVVSQDVAFEAGVKCRACGPRACGPRACRRVRAKVARVPSQSTAQPARSVNAMMLPDEIITQLNAKFQCREQQIQYLAAIYCVS